MKREGEICSLLFTNRILSNIGKTRCKTTINYKDIKSTQTDYLLPADAINGRPTEKKLRTHGYNNNKNIIETMNMKINISKCNLMILNGETAEDDRKQENANKKH